MNKYALLYAAGCFLLLTGCQRELDENDWVFSGDWESKHYALQIYRNGYGACNSRKWIVPVTYEGRVKITSNRIVFIDTEDEIRKRFTIDQRPAKDSSGATFMVLDGERFTRH